MHANKSHALCRLNPVGTSRNPCAAALAPFVLFTQDTPDPGAEQDDEEGMEEESSPTEATEAVRATKHVLPPAHCQDLPSPQPQPQQAQEAVEEDQVEEWAGQGAAAAAALGGSGKRTRAALRASSTGCEPPAAKVPRVDQASRPLQVGVRGATQCIVLSASACFCCLSYRAAKSSCALVCGLFVRPALPAHTLLHRLLAGLLWGLLRDCCCGDCCCGDCCGTAVGRDGLGRSAFCHYQKKRLSPADDNVLAVP